MIFCRQFLNSLRLKVLNSLTENIFGVNYALFITQNEIGNANKFPLEMERLKDGKVESEEAETLPELEDYINFVRGVSFWRVKHGNFLTD